MRCLYPWLMGFYFHFVDIRTRTSHTLTLVIVSHIWFWCLVSFDKERGGGVDEEWDRSGTGMKRCNPCLYINVNKLLAKSFHQQDKWDFYRALCVIICPVSSPVYEYNTKTTEPRRMPGEQKENKCLLLITLDYIITRIVYSTSANIVHIHLKLRRLFSLFFCFCFGVIFFSPSSFMLWLKIDRINEVK